MYARQVKANHEDYMIKFNVSEYRAEQLLIDPYREFLSDDIAAACHICRQGVPLICGFYRKSGLSKYSAVKWQISCRGYS